VTKYYLENIKDRTQVKFAMIILNIFLTLEYSQVQGQDNLSTACKNASISKKNSISQNVRLALNWIQSDYQMRREEEEKINSYIAKNDLKGLRKLLGPALPERLLTHPIEQLQGNLDMQRNLTEALQKNGHIAGAACRTRALLVANLLHCGGLPSDKVFIVEAVTENGFKSICSEKTTEKDRADGFDLSGHTFLIFKDPKNSKWKLINPSYPYDSAFNLNGEGFTFPSPEEIKRSQYPVYIADDANPYLKDHGRMVIFSTSEFHKSPNYWLEERINMIASGKPNDRKCSKYLPARDLNLPAVRNRSSR